MWSREGTGLEWDCHADVGSDCVLSASGWCSVLICWAPFVNLWMVLLSRVPCENQMLRLKKKKKEKEMMF